MNEISRLPRLKEVPKIEPLQFTVENINSEPNIFKWEEKGGATLGLLIQACNDYTATMLNMSDLDLSRCGLVRIQSGGKDIIEAVDQIGIGNDIRPSSDWISPRQLQQSVVDCYSNSPQHGSDIKFKPFPISDFMVKINPKTKITLAIFTAL